MLSINEIAERLKKDRNLKAVADNTGLSYPTVWAFANGKAENPSHQSVQILSDYLEANP